MLLSVPAFAQDEKKEEGKQGGPPPAMVVTAKVGSGEVAPEVSYIGTVMFHELSDVAAEVAGKVVSLEVDHGQKVSQGDPLVVLSSDLLDKTIANARSLMEQAKADYELAHLDDERMTKLFKTRSVSEGEFDKTRLGAAASERKYHALRATLDRLQLERAKKTIRAPYDGVVLERKVHRGEWVSQGATVITMAGSGEVDVEVNVPAGPAQVVKPGLKVEVRVGAEVMNGEVYAVIPKGDVSTRTFPVKIRVLDPVNLAEGMEARVSLPSDVANKTLVVPRDAVISARGQTVVWAVLDGKALPMPVQVVGYRGLDAGVLSDKLQEGMDIVIKGNERLRPNQAVAPMAAEK
ncbi:efflux RND transporter periplasmic adaptor subunit [Salidesulfovibrio onnuriiensis]|uniref:efflux RND transporter periplasmic adaptor subunit n=1 Tax=Salidesulfovibrio onnuriiensis TaxID=2583823 RepID=UPI00202AE82B|nr:efflux RND transporter periplasmic adaptor subunit [Salidesulfovibrio onnuriiensis]